MISKTSIKNHSTKMLLQCRFLHFSCFLMLFPLKLSASKPGCQTHCGNLEIPFPFGLGIGSNCSIGPWFDIHCNTSTEPPKAYLYMSNFQVTEISGSQIRVRHKLVGYSCYNTSMPDVPMPIGGPLLNILEWSTLVVNLSSTPYTLSDANQLTAFGCDDLATAAVQGPTTNINEYGGGCVAYCTESSDTNSSGYCPGNGCCLSPLPKGINFIRVSLSDLHRNWRTSKLHRCNSAFVGLVENGTESKFTYNKSQFMNNPPMDTSTTLVLDWKIGSQNCSTAQNSNNFLCKQNSLCVDSDDGNVGYICNCTEGFEGNPYLTPGCQDVDECKNNPCHPSAICTNSPGSFSCSCPRGFYGDGTSSGFGCSQVPKSFPAAVIGLTSGIGFLLALSICFWSYKLNQRRKRRKRRKNYFKRNGGLLLQQQISPANQGSLGKTNLFLAKDLEKATDQYSESRILGQGGQGTVYKGMLSDGKIVAIKKSKLVDENQVEQFINEVVILSQINHRNVVKLLGCCLETEVPLLVYEFVPNGTLFDLIHDRNTDLPFSWSLRLKIARDVAGAIAYLHSATSLPIFHRDIKSSNILLDEKYIAKVSDFGTSRSVAVDQTHLTTLVKGTFGYLDPEYFQSSQFTEKSDVYSFGVVLVELLTGKKPICSNRTGEERSLAIEFLLAMERNNVDKILDGQVAMAGNKEEAIAVARLARECLNLNGRKRPTMKEVATKLENIRMSQLSSNGNKPSHCEKFTEEAEAFAIVEHKYKAASCVHNVGSSSEDACPLMFDTV